MLFSRHFPQLSGISTNQPSSDARGEALSWRSGNTSTRFIISIGPTSCCRWMPTFSLPPGNLTDVREFSDRRRVTVGERDAKQATMNRLYVVECTPSITGAKADHRWAMPARQIESFARALAAELDPKLESLAEGVTQPVPAASIAALVRDLRKNGSRSFVVPGDHQPPIVHALAHAMNAALGAVGTTVTYTDPIEAQPTNRCRRLPNWSATWRREGRDCWSFSASMRPMSAPVDLEFARQVWRKCRSRSTSVSIKTRRRRSANGTFPRPIFWNPGAMPAPATARRRSCSR